MGLSMRTADDDLGMNGHGPASGDEAHSQPAAQVGSPCQAMYSLNSACWLAAVTSVAEWQESMSNQGASALQQQVEWRASFCAQDLLHGSSDLNAE